MVMHALSWHVGGQVIMATGAKSSEKQGIFYWLNKTPENDGLLETDPVLQKVDWKNGAFPSLSAKEGISSAPPKKQNFFGWK